MSASTARDFSLFGDDEVHMTQIARHVIDAHQRDGNTRAATGQNLL